MNIEKILQDIDVLYSQQKIEDVEILLVNKIQELKKENHIYPTITLMNELLGIYREKGDISNGTKYCDEILEIFTNYNLSKDENFATSLLNIATAHRSFGNYDLSKKYYEDCHKLFEQCIDKNDYRVASLYNNISLLFIETENYPEAILNIEKSLEILKTHQNVEVQMATANTSLSQIYINLNDLNKAQHHIKIALDIFENFEDYHYSATLSTYAQIEFLLNNLKNSANLYKKAMIEIEKYVGKSENYKILEENYNSVQSLINSNSNSDNKKWIEVCKDFYINYGVAMIKTHFSTYENKIAVGLVGHGSECFGFDDEFSKDHDFEVGFYMWLTDDVYNKIGDDLQKEYQKISNSTKQHVFRINNFYKSILDFNDLPITDSDWLKLSAYQLAEATNGEIFCDNLGEFSKIRENLLNHFPLQVLCQKIAEQSHLVSQTGQYNFKRALKRKDFVTARIILSDFLKYTMDLVFLLNKIYPPYYKWTYKKFQTLPILSNLSDYFEEINSLNLTDEKISTIIESIVFEIITELKSQKFIENINNTNFLDFYVKEISNSPLKATEIIGEKIELVKKIVVLEWSAFDKVQGVDGRATCQDDLETFDIMRSSQFLAWSNELLRCYMSDFTKATSVGRNLITEKYAFMMKSTDFESFKEIEHMLPKISPEHSVLIEKIVSKQLELMLELQPKYPKLVSQGRSLLSSEDSLYNTSYETYLRGELSTYSFQTCLLYLDLIELNSLNGLNTAKLYMENVARLYGYPDVETAEENIQ